MVSLLDLSVHGALWAEWRKEDFSLCGKPDGNPCYPAVSWSQSLPLANADTTPACGQETGRSAQL